MADAKTARRTLTGEIELSPGAVENAAQNVGDFRNQFTSVLQKDTTEILQFVLATAIALRASDIHLEPEEEHVKIRFRIDGMLRDATEFGLNAYTPLLSRIKLISGIKLNITDRPQDGRFSVNEKQPIEIRVSSLPSEHGESLALRVLDPKSLLLLKDLGLREDLLKLFEKEIKKPNGMILVTGPTGSGKTTTLYAFLKTIQNPEIKIITIEDPIEYHVNDISQTQVNPGKGYDFASGLRAIVRQDPDVILVGEMRDEATVDIALQAALTGHLVFSTLHTNDAAGTISRLISLGGKPVNIAPALNLIIAQRLIRTLCKKCAKAQPVSPQELAILTRELKKENITKNTKVFHQQGCKECGPTGYRGRIGIFEAIVRDDDIREHILSSSSTSSFKKLAVQKGMLTMKQDGLLKVLKGITTIEEVERVTG